MPKADREKLILRCDGASRGNPGPAGVGAVVADGEGRVLRRASSYIGPQTNNVAEYKALLAALELAKGLKAQEVEVRLDSELLTRQLSGQYKVRSPSLKPLHQEVQKLLGTYRRVTIKYVSRDQNREADLLARRAISSALKEKEGDDAPGGGCG